MTSWDDFFGSWQGCEGTVGRRNAVLLGHWPGGGATARPSEGREGGDPGAGRGARAGHDRWSWPSTPHWEHVEKYRDWGERGGRGGGAPRPRGWGSQNHLAAKEGGRRILHGEGR